jgi:hypothetical protein
MSDLEILLIVLALLVSFYLGYIFGGLNYWTKRHKKAKALLDKKITCRACGGPMYTRISHFSGCKTFSSFCGNCQAGDGQEWPSSWEAHNHFLKKYGELDND